MTNERVSYGRLNPEQEEALRPFIEGCIVHDLGAGDRVLSERMVRLGAFLIYAVDKPGIGPQSTVNEVIPVASYYYQYKDPIDIAFMSWPSNHYLPCLRKLAERARVVVYLGRNTDMTACGDTHLFQHFIQRDVLAYVPDRHNTLIVYGGLLPMSRDLFGEEKAAFSQDKVMSYEEAEKLVEPRPETRLRVLAPV